MHNSKLTFHTYKNELNIHQYTTTMKTILLWAIATLLFITTAFEVINYFHPNFKTEPTLNQPPQILISAYICFFVAANAAVFLAFQTFAAVTKRTINANLPPWLAIILFAPVIGTLFLIALFFIPEEWVSKK